MKINKSIQDFFCNKRILILGFGREGKSTLSFLQKFIVNPNVTIADKNPVSIDYPTISKLNIISGDNYLDAILDAEIVMKSPGVSLKDYAIPPNVIISSQTDLFIKLFKNQIIGITGTKGKSTTSTLIYHILKENHKNAILVGNIGIPALDKIDEIDESTFIVYELSSHQLEFCNHSPHIAALLNLFQEHLDHYKSYKEYRAAKWNIVKYQLINDIFVQNHDDEMTQIDYKKNSNLSSNISISILGDKRCIVYFDEKLDDIIIENIPIGLIKSKLQIIGKHNIYNLMVSLAVCKSLNIKIHDILQSCYSFHALPHRLEYVGNVRSIDFVNDSISTIPEATISAIKSIVSIETIILGGFDRKISYDILIDFLINFKPLNVILLGDVGLRINMLLIQNQYHGKINFVNNLEEAVEYAFSITSKNMTCLLSPAAASYDKFKNFEERGELFKKLIDEHKMKN